MGFRRRPPSSRTRSAGALLAAIGAALAVPGVPAEARAADDDDSLEFGETSFGESIPAAEIMDAAIKKYDATDFAGASLDFYQIVAAAGDPEAEKFRQKAEYMLGRALYQLGYYQSAMSYFDRVVDEGAEHRYYKATHKMLYLIYKKLADPGIVEKLSRYDRADYDERFRDDLLATVGAYHYAQGDLDEALNNLRAVPRESRNYAKAKFLEGILYVRKNEAKPAVEAFKEILRVVETDPGAVTDPDLYQRLAWLSLARIFYSTAQYELALKYYDKVPVESPQWLEALLESAWAFFQLDNFEKALGNLHTLDSPYFADEYFPESHVLRAVLQFTTCNYDHVKKGAEGFMAVYQDLRTKLDGYLKQYEDPTEFWGFLVALNREGGEYGARTAQIFNAAFSDKSLARMHRFLRRVDAELGAIKQARGKWGESGLAAQLVQDVEVVRSLAIHSAGTMARSRLQRVTDDLRELISQMRKVEFETANAEVGQLENSLRDEQYQAKDVRGVEDLKKTDDEHVYWPFQDEYWKDELGSYVYTVKVKCGR